MDKFEMGDYVYVLTFDPAPIGVIDRKHEKREAYYVTLGDGSQMLVSVRNLEKAC